MPSDLFLALIGCLHIKPMIIGNYLSLNKRRKTADCVCVCSDLSSSWRRFWIPSPLLLILFFCAFSHQVCGSCAAEGDTAALPLSPRASISLFRDARAGERCYSSANRIAPSRRSAVSRGRERDWCMLGLCVRRSNTRLLAGCFVFPSALKTDDWKWG